MRHLRYLNTVLTLIAVLLTMNLYVAWNTTPAGHVFGVASEAYAEPGLTNAGAQRKEMVDLLKKISVQMGELKSTMTDGSLRARMEAGRSE